MIPTRRLSPVVRGCAVLLVALMLAGCAGTSELLRHSAPPAPAPNTSAGRSYLTQLTAAQARLAAAERALPTHPHTPVQLAHSITLLGVALRGLASQLRAITPPADVAPLHRRLIAIASAYAARLRTLARQAAKPQSEVAAANAIVSATGVASAAFTATSAKIRERLAR